MLLDSPQSSVVLLDQSRLSTLHPLVELGDRRLTLLLLLLDHHLHLLMILHLDVCAGRETAAVMKEDERRGRSGERKGNKEIRVPGLKGHLIGAELTGVLTSDPVLVVVGELHQLRLMFL